MLVRYTPALRAASSKIAPAGTSVFKPLGSKRTVNFFFVPSVIPHARFLMTASFTSTFPEGI